jgi:hypothetical protein
VGERERACDMPALSSPPEVPATEARNWMTFFVFSVLPAPDSPLPHSPTVRMRPLC